MASGSLAPPFGFARLPAFILLLLAGCNGADEQRLPQAEPDTTQIPDTMDIAVAPVFRYVCPDGDEFSVQYRNGVARVILSDTSVDLSRRSDAEHYASGDIELQADGRDATLLWPGRRFGTCSSEYENSAGWTEARARGVDFRAVGQEPPWMIEVFGDERLVLTTDYGEAVHEVEDLMITTDESQVETIYRGSTDGRQLEVHVVAEPCEDIMSGEPFEATVTVRLGDRELHGCGRALQ